MYRATMPNMHTQPNGTTLASKSATLDDLLASREAFRVRAAKRLSPSEQAIDRFLYKLEAFLDRYIVTPFLGAHGDASDF